jgi:hypothetical protein
MSIFENDQSVRHIAATCTESGALGKETLSHAALAFMCRPICSGSAWRAKQTSEKSCDMLVIEPAEAADTEQAHSVVSRAVSDVTDGRIGLSPATFNVLNVAQSPT